MDFLFSNQVNNFKFVIPTSIRLRLFHFASCHKQKCQFLLKTIYLTNNLIKLELTIIF